VSAEKPSIVCRCAKCRKKQPVSPATTAAPGAKVAALSRFCLAMTLPASTAPRVVLDTNVVLDWLLFRDPECAALHGAVVARELQWIATDAMRAELAYVLDRGRLDPWRPDLGALWAAWERHCTTVATPMALAPAGRLRCSDPDDQKFIDLAVAGSARWLVSRDRAVLKLARRLSVVGVEVITPARWTALSAAPG
jgi:predicted nucleic acid-binding protein